MTDLVLTQERRAELTALLDDEARLQAEYPRLVEYLDMAARLPGTGDAERDRAFDVRMVHYMTAGSSTSANPYWDIVASSVSEQEGRRVVDGGHRSGSGRLAFAEMVLQAAYAYGIPSPETIDWMSRFCGGRPVLELGAGCGYWAAQLSRAGLVVDAYDLEPPDRTENISFPRAEGQADVWYPVRGLAEAWSGDRAEHVLFLCWPPGWGDTMASDALVAFEKAGGDRLVYIGEPKGGKTGDDAFFDALADRWRPASVDAGYVSWWNLADTAQGWTRR